MAKVRVFQLGHIDLSFQKSNPPQLLIAAQGTVLTSGWTGADLKPLEKTLSADGILDLEFVAEPPDGITLPVLTPIAATHTWDSDAEKVVAVRVVARSNELIEPIFSIPRPIPGPFPPVPFPKSPVLGEEGPWTTLAVGEEQFPKKAVLGEENIPKTLALGEENPPKPVIGETGPAGETIPGKGVVGEVPDFFTLMGRRNPFGDR